MHPPDFSAPQGFQLGINEIPAILKRQQDFELYGRVKRIGLPWPHPPSPINPTPKVGDDSREELPLREDEEAVSPTVLSQRYVDPNQVRILGSQGFAQYHPLSVLLDNHILRGGHQ